MCGIVGAVALRNVVEILLEGLRRLEYRGYDSAGLAVINSNGYLQRVRRVGTVSALIEAIQVNPVYGNIGIAHTRWATHGTLTENNAHPHISEHIVVVHNGIIENHKWLRQHLCQNGYVFVTQTDTEVIAHLIHWEQCLRGGALFKVMQRAVGWLQGTYGAVIMDSRDPSILVAARCGSSLVIGLGIDENFIASDQLALLPNTSHFMSLEEGDIAEITCCDIRIWDRTGAVVKRNKIESHIRYDAIEKGIYHHYMQKEIFEQPRTIKNTLKGRFSYKGVKLLELSNSANTLLSRVKHIQIVACGTSYHSAMVSRYWFESLARVPCNVEIASEFRYSNPANRPNSLLITLSQSGETADTLEALRLTKSLNYLGSLAVCNVANSSLVRESDIVLMIRAGSEISVASTKAFTAQLTVLLMLVAHISRLQGMSSNIEKNIARALHILPSRIAQILLLDKSIKKIAKNFYDKEHALFLGRGNLYPIAMEGALKLKEISYIHAEAYAAGELKHGPIALIDNKMPVIIIAPNNELLDKIKSNIEEVHIRGGLLYIFSEHGAGFSDKDNMKTILMPRVNRIIAPIIYTIPMQLLAYHIALVKGTEIDKPRNLAKSVTVE